MDNERILRSRRAMQAAGVDALVCRLPENVRMLTGYWPLNGMSVLLLPLDGTPLIVVPHCEEREAREELWNADCVTFRVGVLGADDPYEAISGALRKHASGKQWRRVGIESSFETVAPPWNAAEPAVPASETQAMLEGVFGSDALIDAGELLVALRSRKTPDEQAQFRIANEISAFGLSAFSDAVDVGISGVELVAAVEAAVVVKGSGYRESKRVRAFAQVSTGNEETSAGYRPMEITTTRRMRSGDIALLELAVVVDGLWSDRTRVRVAGRASDLQQEAFEVVRKAQEAAIRAVTPGATSGDVDTAARSIIHSAGWTDREFLHVTGHGIGFRYHEPIPLILPGGDTVLEEGMLHTVEPGIYRPDFGGMRIEDNVLVTESGAEVLGPYEKVMT